jgi:hypothetical protein
MGWLLLFVQMPFCVFDLPLHSLRDAAFHVHVESGNAFSEPPSHTKTQSGKHAKAARKGMDNCTFYSGISLRLFYTFALFARCLSPGGGIVRRIVGITGNNIEAPPEE